MKLYKVFFALVRKQSSKILAPVLQVKPANTIISPPFLTKRTEMATCRKRAFYRSVWCLNVCRAVPPSIFPHNLLNVRKSVIVELAIHKNRTYLFLKQQVDKELFVTEL